MRMTVILQIEDGRTPKVEATAYSKETANIYIDAETVTEAQELLEEGKGLATQAMKEWQPVEVPIEEAAPVYQHYHRAPMSEETAREYMEIYESTTSGKRFCAGLKNAYEFTHKKDKTGFMTFSQGRYMLFLAYAECVDKAILHSYCYGYKKGYNKAKKGGK